MGHFLWEAGHWLGIVLVVGFGILFFFGVIIYDYEKHKEYDERDIKPRVTWEDVKAIQFYRADGTNLAKGRPSLSEFITDEFPRDDDDGSERRRDVHHTTELHDSGGGLDDDWLGWN